METLQLRVILQPLKKEIKYKCQLGGEDGIYLTPVLITGHLQNPR